MEVGTQLQESNARAAFIAFSPCYLEKSGLPDDCHYFAARELQEEEPPISWLTAAELTKALAHASLGMEDLSETAQLVVERRSWECKP